MLERHQQPHRHILSTICAQCYGQTSDKHEQLWSCGPSAILQLMLWLPQWFSFGWMTCWLMISGDYQVKIVFFILSGVLYCVWGQNKHNIMWFIYKPESSGGLFLMYHYTIIFVTEMKPEIYWEEIWCMYACQAVISTLISDLHTALSIP